MTKFTNGDQNNFNSSRPGSLLLLKSNKGVSTPYVDVIPYQTNNILLGAEQPFSVDNANLYE